MYIFCVPPYKFHVQVSADVANLAIVHFVDMRDDSFPKELTDREYLYWKGHNLDNQKIRECF